MTIEVIDNQVRDGSIDSSKGELGNGDIRAMIAVSSEPFSNEVLVLEC